MKCNLASQLASALLPMAASTWLIAASGFLYAEEALVESPALAVRPPRQAPTLPGLARFAPQPVPGVGQLHRAYSPCLSADLKTIVFANWFSRKTQYDLYLARRQKVDDPFGEAELIEGAVTPWTDAYPALSADGLELVYLSADDAHPEKTPKLLRATRPDGSSPFSQAKELTLPGIDASRLRISSPQFVDELRLKFCLIESASVRTVRMASRRQKDSPFRSLELLPLENHWPLWWVSADGLRAYAGLQEGICLAYRSSPADEFGPMEVIVPARLIGKIDGPIWLAPQEDVIFYCSPGQEQRPDAGRHLMMVAF